VFVLVVVVVVVVVMVVLAVVMVVTVVVVLPTVVVCMTVVSIVAESLVSVGEVPQAAGLVWTEAIAVKRKQVEVPSRLV
jgi:hypothetical protein